jgi:hypothetical protein
MAGNHPHPVTRKVDALSRKRNDRFWDSQALNAVNVNV